jgi:hypothetical protein
MAGAQDDVYDVLCVDFLFIVQINDGAALG